MIKEEQPDSFWTIERNRCFLGTYISVKDDRSKFILTEFGRGAKVEPELFIKYLVAGIIHVPLQRGAARFLYPLVPIGPTFPASFEESMASVLVQWSEKDGAQLRRIEEMLNSLGLGYTLNAKPVGIGLVEIRVSQLTPGSKAEQPVMLHLAHVGCAVRSALPVLVALAEADEGQLVYVEHPELNLHPRAQVAMAKILADAAQRRVRAVVETHSSLLLLAIQTLAAGGDPAPEGLPLTEKFYPDLMKLHWFSLDEEDGTVIDSGGLDHTGAFGDWPGDFGDVELQTDNRYLDSAEKRQLGL